MSSLSAENKKETGNFETELLNVINHKLGIVVKTTQLKDLHKIVVEACTKLKISETEYLKTIKNSSIDSSIMKNLINSITIGETYFFRDEKQMELIKEVILPQIIHQKRLIGDLTIRIWSAGCASGEELYSVIIMLNEMLADKHSWKLYFLGTDINSRVLHKAIVGEYSEWSMRAINDYYKTKYLTKSGSNYILDQAIKDQAQFHYLNLNNDSYPSIINGTAAIDLILCRNVLIYFDAQHSNNIMKKFSMSLIDGGYLLLGASDPIEIQDTALVLQPEHGKLLRMSEMQIEETKPKPEIQRVAATPVAMPKPKAIEPPKQEIDLAQLTKQKRWAELLDKVNNLSKENYWNANILSAKAEALANLGNLKDAAECCELSLKIDSIRLGTYFTYAMILMGLRDLKGAEAALRKTLFLDKDFVLGHFQLGLLLMGNNELEAGLKSLKNAYAITQQKNVELSVPGYEELTYGKLTDILAEEIQLHEIGSDTHETE